VTPPRLRPPTRFVLPLIALRFGLLIALLLTVLLLAVLPASPAAAAPGSPADPWPGLSDVAIPMLAHAPPMLAQTASLLAQTGPAVPPAAPAQGSEAPALPAAEENPAPGGMAARAWQGAWDAISGQSVVLGLGYTQGTLKFPRFRGDSGAQPQITDNGRITLLLRYETTERYFAEYPLRVGKAALGYNFAGSYSALDVDHQLQSSAFAGTNLGTSVKGDYLDAAPQLFVRLGPLYADRAVFWKFAVGLGAALVRMQGSVLPHNGTVAEPAVAVDSHGVRLAEYITVNWELQVEHWLLAFQSHYLAGRADTDPFTYEVYALSLGYSLRF
jgi:hypothetical protein